MIAVNNLAVVDTDAAEALHIPSHYDIQHGMWEETAEANMRAFRSSMKWWLNTSGAWKTSTITTTGT